MAIFTGSGVAIVTPIHPNESVNYEALEKLIEFQLQNETDAIIVCGTTGEASTLTDEEQIEIIRFTVDKVKKRVPVIAGAGSNYTAHGATLCIESQKAGADACLLITPYYNKTTQKGLIAHYTYIAKKIDIPVILYNLPARTGMNMTAKTAYELSKIDNIVALKEASGDFKQIAEIAHLCGDTLTLYSGNDEQILPILSLGGKGVISVLANIAPKQTHDMVMNYLNGNHATAVKYQLEAMPLISALFSEVSPIPVKAALNSMGFEVGSYRMPLVDMDEMNYAVLEKEMKAYGLYNR